MLGKFYFFRLWVNNFRKMVESLILPLRIDITTRSMSYSGHESRKSLEIYSKLSLSDAQTAYEDIIGKFPV